MFLCIYFPVWIDTFGQDNEKTIWLTILQTTVPLGVVLGYGITAIFDSEFKAWQISYHLQALFYLILFVIFALIPTSFIEDPNADKNDDEEEEEVQKSKLKPGIKEEVEVAEGYLSSSESEDDGYQCEMSSKADISSVDFGDKKTYK